jgi:hypothetical protein
MRGETLLCEDSALFNLPLSYSVVVSSSELLVYQIPIKETLDIWPLECQNEVKVKILEKYSLFYERLLEIESHLSNKSYSGGALQVLPNTISKENASILDAARKVERHTAKNYPKATQIIKNNLKSYQMQISNKNDKIYMTT